MKLIFLDIDGVLNSIVFQEIKELKGVNSLDCLGKAEKNIDPNNLDLLRLLVEETQAKLVISSTWRKDIFIIGSAQTEEEKTSVFKNMFALFGWENAPIIGITPKLNGFRGHEVATYLEEINKITPVEDYLILDDDSDFILGDLSEVTPYHLDQMGLLEKESQDKASHFWHHQKLLLTSKLTGLTYENVITVLKEWNPESDLVKTYEDYLPYLPRYGKKFN